MDALLLFKKGVFARDCVYMNRKCCPIFLCALLCAILKGAELLNNFWSVEVSQVVSLVQMIC